VGKGGKDVARVTDGEEQEWEARYPFLHSDFLLRTCHYLGDVLRTTGAHYTATMSSTQDTNRVFCAQCDQPEERCWCDKYCVLCQSPYEIRLCTDGLMYCEPCRTACDYKTAG